jgi:hypothetical protein
MQQENHQTPAELEVCPNPGTVQAMRLGCICRVLTCGVNRQHFIWHDECPVHSPKYDAAL